MSAQGRINLGTDPREWADAELVTLTEEEIAQWVEIEAACVGVELLPPDPGPKPAVTLPDPDATLYTVKYGWHFSLDYADEKSAQLVRDALLGARPARVVTSSNRNGAESITESGTEDDVDIKKKCVHSATQWATAKAGYTRQAEELKRWEDAFKEYKRVLGEREGIEVELRDRISQARYKLDEIARAQDVLAKYLVLAEGVREIALVFMANASPKSVALLGLEAEVDAARNPTEDQKAVRALRHRIGKIRRLAGKDADEEAAGPADEEL